MLVSYVFNFVAHYLNVFLKLHIYNSIHDFCLSSLAEQFSVWGKSPDWSYLSTRELKSLLSAYDYFGSTLVEV